MQRPLSIAIIGAGPSGFYAAEALQKHAAGALIDLYDRLPTPFGLVRGGVAPDHPKIKSVTRVFDRVAQQPGFRFRGHVEIGSDLSVSELRQHYDAVIWSYGAQRDRKLGIPGEQLPGSHAATDLVGWYNGHPDYSELRFDLRSREASVIGIGNVAMDVARILLTPHDVLATTDLAAHALVALRESQLQTVYVLARRGPVQAACTTPELRELGEIDDVDVIVDPEDVELDPVSAEYLATAGDRTAGKNMELFREWAARGATGATRRIVFRFAVSPLELLGSDRVEAVRVARNALEPDERGGVRAVPTAIEERLPSQLVFRSVGYYGAAIDGLPFDARAGVIPTVNGRVVDAPGSHDAVAGMYACGWIRRGPHGVIGTNKSCAADTVKELLADAAAGRVYAASGTREQLDELLQQRGVDVVDWEDWQRLDAEEVRRGTPAGRPREKVVDVQEMMAIVRRR